LFLLIALFVIFFKIPFILAENPIISISPTETYLRTSTNEKICASFDLEHENLDKNLEVFLLWSNSGLRINSLLEHTLSSDQAGIAAIYNSELSKSEDSFRVCFIPKNPGFFHAALLLKPKGSSFGVGSWVSLEVNGITPNQDFKLTNDSQNSLISLNTREVKISANSDNKTPIFLMLFILLFVLCLILILILRK